MNFRQWLEVVETEDEEDAAQKNAELYFSIGHGDDDPDYVVWAYIDGKIQIAEPEDGGDVTHGSVWGHSVTDRSFKGRYEKNTGRLSIVKPERLRFYGTPTVVMQAIHRAFDYITDVHEF